MKDEHQHTTKGEGFKNKLDLVNFKLFESEAVSGMPMKLLFKIITKLNYIVI